MRILSKILKYFKKFFTPKEKQRETIWLDEPLTVGQLLTETRDVQQKVVKPEILEAYQKHKQKETPPSALKTPSSESTIEPVQKSKILKAENSEHLNKITSFIDNAKKDFTPEELMARKLEILTFLKTFKNKQEIS